MISVDNKIGVRIPELLMPVKNIDMGKWSVVACDQYTSQVEYWKQVEELIGDNPSTLNMIYPEVYLEDDNINERIRKINIAMETYVKQGMLVSKGLAFVYVERRVSNGKIRRGLMLSVDLEKYDYHSGANTLIRATEGTVLERIPPRMKIRENAILEVPHIMLLIDDPNKTVIDPLADCTDILEKLYDFDLMMDGGNIKGYKVDNIKVVNNILKSFETLADPDIFAHKYGISPDKGVLLFAVGDGNHSLATAKACWEQIKQTLTQEEAAIHPARYALVEVVNVHDEALEFEPIHRIVFNTDLKSIIDAMLEYYQRQKIDITIQLFNTKELMLLELENYKIKHGIHILPLVSSGQYGIIIVNNPNCQLEVGTLQSFLDDYISKDDKVKIDYIHGEEVVDQLGSINGNVGFYLPAMDKYDLFKTVILDGALPRKTFSMGEAHEKRYYLECKKIK